MAKMKSNNRGRVGMVLYVFYLCILAVSLFVIGRVLYLSLIHI